MPGLMSGEIPGEHFSLVFIQIFGRVRVKGNITPSSMITTLPDAAPPSDTASISEEV